MRPWRRFQALDLFTRFSIVACACIVAISASFAYAFSVYLRSYGEDREAYLTTIYVRQAVREHVPIEWFSVEDPKAASSTETWGKISKFFLFGDIFRVKVYDSKGVILWSDEERLIGQSFDDHPWLQKALGGQVVAKFEKSTRAEHVYEREQFEHVMEVYVPIYADAPPGTLLGVVEVYRAPESFLKATRWATLLIWLGSLLAAVFIFASLSTIVRGAHLRQIRLQDELRENAEKLASERQLLNEILDGIDAGVLVVDPSERLLWINETLGKWFPALAAVGGEAGFSDLKDDAHLVLRDSAREVLRGAPNDERDCTLILSNGGNRSFHVASSAIRDASGAITMVVQLIDDVTSRRLMERQLIQAGKMAAVGELAAKVAHEVNNPVGVISGLAKNLLAGSRNDGISGKALCDLDKISANADRIANVVKTLLVFSRPGTTEGVPLNLNTVVQECLSFLGNTFESFNTRMRLELAESLPDVRIDSKQLQQVLVNLINNAADAMPRGGKITLSTGTRRTEEGTDLVWLRVADTGLGIPPEIREEMFAPFFSTKPDGKGTGLGLPISREIVRKYGGSLIMESSGSDGTVFLVELPACVRTEIPDRAGVHAHNP